MSVGILNGNLWGAYVVKATVDVSSCSANTTTEEDFTVLGVKTGDLIIANKPTHSVGLGIVGIRVKSDDTVSITFGNFTGSPINPSSQTYTFVVFRNESATPPSVVGN